MATATGRGDKVAFLKDLLGRKPEVNHKDAGRAWQEAGHEGTISGTSFYRVKSDLGLSGKGQSGGGDAAGKPVPKKTKPKPTPKVKRTVRAAEPVERPGPHSNGQADAEEARGRAAAPQEGNRERVLDQVEADIDEIIFNLKGLGGMPEVEAALREVRRMVHPSLR